MDLLKKQVREFQETKSFTINQAMLLRIKNDCEAFAESLQALSKPLAQVQQLNKRLVLVINSLSSLLVKTTSGETISWWDLISDFRAIPLQSRLNSCRSDQLFAPADR